MILINEREKKTRLVISYRFMYQNLILRGSDFKPGTGKPILLSKKLTPMELAIWFQVSWQSNEDCGKLNLDKVQFHPSYDYTDFVAQCARDG